MDSNVEEALRKMIDLGHLSSGVGHHVINAFSAVVSNAELLRLDPPLPSIADPAVLADTIIRTSLEASTVARRLIDYIRPVTSIDANRRLAFQAERLALDEFVSDYVENFKCKEGPPIQWELHLTPLSPILADAFQLRSMLDHLVDNAVDSFPADGGIIKFTTDTDRRGWNILEVQDNGHGMDEIAQERAVEPFFSTKSGHLGVGLSIANGIWRRHRGTLSIRSLRGEGTNIRLSVEPTRL